MFSISNVISSKSVAAGRQFHDGAGHELDAECKFVAPENIRALSACSAPDMLGPALKSAGSKAPPKPPGDSGACRHGQQTVGTACNGPLTSDRLHAQQKRVILDQSLYARPAALLHERIVLTLQQRLDVRSTQALHAAHDL